MSSDVAPVKFNGVVGMAMRRWYLVLIGMLVTLPLSYLAAQHVAPSYTMKASVVLLAPEKTVGAGGNPYLAMGGLDAAVDVVAAGLSSDAVQERLALTGATSGIVERDGATSAPILLVTVEGPTKEAAQAGVASLVAEVPDTLSSIQRAAGVDATQQIHSEVIASSKKAVVSYKPQLRAALMVLIAGTAATFLLTAVTDSLLRRRRRRRYAEARAEARGERPQLQISGALDVEDDKAEVSPLDLMTARGRKR
jgi:hypothetical protein